MQRYPSLDEDLEGETAASEPKKDSDEPEEPYDIMGSVNSDPDRDPSDAQRDRTTEREMVTDLTCREYFVILYKLFRIEYEVHRQIMVWQQSNTVMARQFGIYS